MLAQGTPDAPSGVTVDLARELASRIGVPVDLLCFDAARDSFAAIEDGRTDVCFLAVDPARAEAVAFSAPYAVIEGVFVVPGDSPLTTSDDVDRPGVRVGVKTGSAYDLFLTRTLAHAELVRGAEGTTVFLDEGLEAGAGIRQPVMDFAAAHPGTRVLEPRFMEIQQAVGVPRSRSGAAVDALRAFVEDVKASGFVAESLARSGRTDASVAPPA